jgi:ABC-type transporter Mla subunit MlaD
MAAIFQIRRGSGSVSLTDGELYLHKGSGSLQVALGTTPITLARLNDVNSGSLTLSGDVTASNIFVSGNLTVSGNLFLGNTSSDNISALGVFTTNLVPNPNNGIDIGTPTAIWRTIYANSVTASLSGSVNGINVTELSQSINSQLGKIYESTASLNLFSASVTSSLEKIYESTASLNSFSSSTLSRLSKLEISTSSLNDFSASVTASLEKIYQSTSSLNNFSASVTSSLEKIYESTASLNSYTSSLKTAIGVSGMDVTVLGNLTVNGTTTQINSTQVNIGENILELNFGGSATEAGIYTKDATGVSLVSGSLLWDSTNDYWKGGKKDLESKILLAGGDNVITSSLQLTNLNQTTQSLNDFSASVTASLEKLYESTASLNLFSASVTASLEKLYESTASLNLFSASVTASLEKLYESTASLNQTTASLNNFSASVTASLEKIYESTASLNSFSASVSTSLGKIYESTASLNLFSSSVTTTLGKIQESTASLNLFSASINFFSSSIFTDFSNSYDAVSESFDYRITILDPGNLSTSILSINQFTSSANGRLNNIEAVTSSYETKGRGIVSGSSQVTPLLPEGVISGSIQILGGSGVWSSSVQMPLGVVSGSSQIPPLLPPGVVSGSSQITSILDSIHSYTSSLKGAITISGTDVSIAGGLTVLGTTTIIDSTTLNIKDNIIQLNGAGSANAGLVVRDASGTTNSGSLLWDTTNDYWIAGALGVESKLLRAGGDNVVSGSPQIDATATTNWSTGIKTVLNSNTVISGSSQIGGISNSQLVNASITIAGTSTTLGGLITADQIRTAIGTVVTGSSQITATSTTGFATGVKTQLDANTVVSGSSQITLSSTTGGGTSANVQFGSLGIGTTASGVSGEIRATGDITAFYSSDIRLKENIQPIQNALEKVESISGNTYDWKKGYEELHSHKGNDVGVIAQEIEAILPQIVTNRDNGYKAVQYEKIVPLLIEAIKELSAKIKRLENK